MSRDGWAALPCDATGLSAVCDCGISWSYSLTIFGTNFQNPNSSSCWEIFDRKKCPYVIYKSERRKKWKLEKRRQNEDKHLNFHLHSTLCLLEGVHKILKHWLQKELRNLWQNFPLERKKNEQIKGLISNMWLFYCDTIQLITIKLCTKFQNPNPS